MKQSHDSGFWPTILSNSLALIPPIIFDSKSVVFGVITKDDEVSNILSLQDGILGDMKILSTVNADETIMMNFPAASTAKRCAVTFADVTTSPADAPDGYSLGDTMFSISIEDEDGDPVTTCIDNPETDTITEVWNVIVEYSDDDLEAAGGNAAALVLAYYDATAEEWEVMDSRVLATTGTFEQPFGYVAYWVI